MEKHFSNSVTKLVDAAEGGIKTVEKKVESVTLPARRSIIKRFPIAFTLFVTFGVTSTFYGFERLLSSYSLTNDHPMVILIIGISVLVLTGTLYKKLG